MHYKTTQQEYADAPLLELTELRDLFATEADYQRERYNQAARRSDYETMAFRQDMIESISDCSHYLMVEIYHRTEGELLPSGD